MRRMGDKAPDGLQFSLLLSGLSCAAFIETAIDYVDKADIFVIIGTSLECLSRCRFAELCTFRGTCGPIFI